MKRRGKDDQRDRPRKPDQVGQDDASAPERDDGSGEHTVDPWSGCSHELISDDRRGEVFCRKCGLVVEVVAVDRAPATSEDRPKSFRRRLRSLFEIGGTASRMAMEELDGQGTKLDGPARRYTQRLARAEWLTRPSRHRERSTSKAIARIVDTCQSLQLPETLTMEAVFLYRRAAEANLVVGRSSDAFAAAAILAITRLTGTPRSLREVSRVADVRPRRVRKALAFLRSTFGFVWPPSDPRAFLPRLASELSVPWPVEQEAKRLLAVAGEREAFRSGSPIGIAAAALVLASSGRVSEGDVCRTAGVSRGSVTRWRRKLLKEVIDTEEP